MQIKHASDNGNDTSEHKNKSQSNVNQINVNNIDTKNVNIINNKKHPAAITGSKNILDIVENNTLYSLNDNQVTQRSITDTTREYKYICNKQYIINAKEGNINNSKTIDEETTGGQHFSDIYLTHEVSANANTLEHSRVDFKPLEEVNSFNQADVNEMSTINVQHLPRGIINPNYPGFQHLAHTLQDYSSTNIESCDPSENEMSEDEIDSKTVDRTPSQESKKLNCNRNYSLDDYESNDDLQSSEITNDRASRNQMPDLLKTLNENNNNDILVGCTTTDIENNFNTKDIIGDFNKEVEEEIKHLLNYNINIEDDLQELRKDIKETFAKPIENTINNISDVVNDVIKRLVENDCCDKNELVSEETNTTNNLVDDSVMTKENETNARTELNISRPTFLLLGGKTHDKITDAVLSDGKDEINVTEYNTQQLSYNVENTIKQLSTELRKIIPKLNEMREREKLWKDTRKDVLTDRNSNNILQDANGPIKCYEDNSWRKIENNLGTHLPVNKKSAKIRSEIRSRQSFVKNMSKVKTSVSVQKEDYEFESFDVYNIETALPDFDAIEHHIKAAKEAERRKRNDREEIRKRLAMDIETEDYYSLGHTDRSGRKPSLHSRLQNGKNLQICFMNETASDNESQTSESERNLNSLSLSQTSLLSKSIYNNPYNTRPLSVNITKTTKSSNTQIGSKLRPSSLLLKTSKSKSTHSLNNIELKESDFFALQATLQTEARIALAQAKEMARIQMERSRAARGSSPVTDMLRAAAAAARVPLLAPRRRLSRRLLTDANVAQLQIIVNELHSQIELLNDSLVKLLMARDELHMGQDSMLVDIEDLTRYLGVKEQTKKMKGTNNKSGVRRLTSLVHK